MELIVCLRRAAVSVVLSLLTGPVWAAGEFIDLGAIGGSEADSFAYGVSADGSAVVGYGADGIHEAFRWKPGTMMGLGDRGEWD